MAVREVEYIDIAALIHIQKSVVEKSSKTADKPPIATCFQVTTNNLKRNGERVL